MTLPEANWRISCDDAVDLMVALGDDLRSLELPDRSLRSLTHPDPTDLDEWRIAAHERLAEALDGLAARVRRGEEPCRATQRTLAAVLWWSRRSLRPMVNEAGAGWFGACLRRGEAKLWDEMSRAVAARADPEEVERFLQIYLEMAFQAAEGGFASLIADEAR